MRKLKLFFILAGAFYLIACNAQTEETAIEIKMGLYLNWGNNKINIFDTLKCFSFDNLMLRTEIIDQMFEYDEIMFSISYIRPYRIEGYNRTAYEDPYIYTYTKKYNKKTFSDNFLSKNEASFWFIPPTGKEAHLLNYDDKGFSRDMMVNTSLKENVRTSFLKIEITARKIESVSEVQGYRDNIPTFWMEAKWSEPTVFTDASSSTPIMILSEYHKKKRDYVSIDMNQECFPFEGETKISTPLE